MHFDPASQDVGNIVFFEHVNLAVPDQGAATDFYVDGLGFTRDPYLMVGTRNMWVNCGRQQFHLPRGEPQRFRGTIGLVVPDLDALESRLRNVSGRLEGTRFSWRRKPARVDVTCPWGNRFRAHAAGGAYGGPLGIPYLEMPIAKGTAAGIARFYRSVMGAPAELSDTGVRVNADPDSASCSTKTRGTTPSTTGTTSRSTSPTSPDRTARSPGAASSPARTTPTSSASSTSSRRGKKVLFSVEHEVRSLHHPLYRRPLVNRTADERLP